MIDRQPRIIPGLFTEGTTTHPNHNTRFRDNSVRYHVTTARNFLASPRMSSTTAPSLARARSLRVPPTNAVKTTPTTPPLPSPGPSNITLFLTNLRLLDLDLRNDWPDINAMTFSTKGAQENQKKRIQCVEWALYHLFVLWDPEEARNVSSFQLRNDRC